MEEGKCIQLGNWCIIPHINGTVLLEGWSESGKHFFTEPISTRISKTLLVCSSGQRYRLMGAINFTHAQASGLSLRVIKAFFKGFPVRWRETIHKEYYLYERKHEKHPGLPLSQHKIEKLCNAIENSVPVECQSLRPRKRCPNLGSEPTFVIPKKHMGSCTVAPLDSSHLNLDNPAFRNEISTNKQIVVDQSVLNGSHLNAKYSKMLVEGSRECESSLRNMSGSKEVECFGVRTLGDLSVKTQTASTYQNEKNRSIKRKLDEDHTLEPETHRSSSTVKQNDQVSTPILRFNTSFSGAKTSLGKSKCEILPTRELRKRNPVQYTFTKNFQNKRKKIKESSNRSVKNKNVFGNDRETDTDIAKGNYEAAGISGTAKTQKLCSQDKSCLKKKPKKIQSKKSCTSKPNTTKKHDQRSTKTESSLKITSDNKGKNIHKMDLRKKTVMSTTSESVSTKMSVLNSIENKVNQRKNNNTVNGNIRNKTNPKSLQDSQNKSQHRKKKQVKPALPEKILDSETTGTKSKISQYELSRKKIHDKKGEEKVELKKMTNKNKCQNEYSRNVKKVSQSHLKNKCGKKPNDDVFIPEGFEDIFRHGGVDQNLHFNLGAFESDSDADESLIRNLKTPDLHGVDPSEVETPTSATSSVLELLQEKNIKKLIKKRISLQKTRKATPAKTKKTAGKVYVKRCMKKFAELDAISKKLQQKVNELSESEGWVSVDEEEISGFEV